MSTRKRSIKYLGIDFGSSTVSVVGYEDKNTKPIIFSDPSNSRTWFDTAMTKDGQYFFHNAFINGYTQDLNVLDSLKENLVTANPVESSKENALLFMKNLLQTISRECDFSQLEKICFGYPTYTIPHKQECYYLNFKEIIKKACEDVLQMSNIQDESIICNPEPILAATAYNEAHKDLPDYKAKIKSGELVLVVDLGGYTLDMAIVEARTDKDRSLYFYPIVASESIEAGSIRATDIIMGKRITREICDCIYKNSDLSNIPTYVDDVDKKKCEFFQNNETESEGVLKMKFDISQPGSSNKTTISGFVLCKETQNDDFIAGNKIKVGLYGTGMHNINLKAKFNSCARYILDYVLYNYSQNAKALGNKKISHILFTGGTSNISTLRETIKSVLGQHIQNENPNEVELLVDNPMDNALKLSRPQNGNVSLSSKNVVALGAAIYAATGLKIHNPYSLASYKTTDPYQDCKRLRDRNDALVKLIESFLDNNNLCKDCAEKVAKLLEDMEYPG